MPAGDNQHTFTCPNCQVRKSRDLHCRASGYCCQCCTTHAACRRRCGACDLTYSRCTPETGVNPAACDLCALHKCTTGTPAQRAYACGCRTCATCGIRQVKSSFFRYGADPDCASCSARLRPNAPKCRNCRSPIGPTNPLMEECCERCQGCCVANDCNGRSDVQHFGMNTTHDPTFGEVPIKQLSTKTQFGFNPIRRTIGYEIECSKFKNGRAISKAVKDIGGAIVGDGSVPDGFEINTPPMNGDKLVHALGHLSRSLLDADAKASAKAGLHIHVDCTDMEYDDMRRMIMLYGRLESGLFSIIDSRRLTANYSKPNGGRSLLAQLSDPANARKDIVKMVYTRPPVKGWESWTKGKSCDGDRYWAMNVHSWFLRGTVEFRLHHGTVRWEKMIGMGMLLGAIADGALSIPERDIVNFPQGKEGLIRIAPTEWCRQWVKERWDHFAKNRKNKDEPIADF